MLTFRVILYPSSGPKVFLIRTKPVQFAVFIIVKPPEMSIGESVSQHALVRNIPPAAKNIQPTSAPRSPPTVCQPLRTRAVRRSALPRYAQDLVDAFGIGPSLSGCRHFAGQQASELGKKVITGVDAEPCAPERDGGTSF
jgi:hypothetical protein